MPLLGLLMLLRALVTWLRLRLGVEWSPPDEYDRVEVASLMPDHPNVWSDGSLVLDRITGVSSAGAGFFAHQSEDCWGGA